tara:strand:+ start:1284 stop:1430 length:147 start_codon:yes stop_codon:yes gene_type:complete
MKKRVKAPNDYYWVKLGNNSYKLIEYRGVFKSAKGISEYALFDTEKKK